MEQSLLASSLAGEDRKSIFFLLGCVRSGTTSLCNILNAAVNASCACEPEPQLHEECRLHWEGTLDNTDAILQAAILPRLEESLRQLPIYGEKNITLSIFAQRLCQLFPCRLILISRDGRDCVNSMRNWHSHMFGNLYREANKQPVLEARAQEVVNSLPVADDLSDRGRPRPLPGDPYYALWPSMSHHQMLCWYWNAWNMRLMDELESIPTNRWRRVDYSSPNLADQVMEAIQFLELEGLTPGHVQQMLSRNVNSVNDRTGECNALPTWRNWSDEELAQFWEICTPAMRRLGYFTPSCPEESRWTPDYGQWWMGQEVSHDFFEQIYQDRQYQHQAFYKWAKPLLDTGCISSALDIGCGHGIGYADFFAGISYTGMDISAKETDWCRSHYSNSRHKWVCGDFIRTASATQYDLVICQGTIENMYDMDALVRCMCASANKYVYLAGFYGFHDDIDNHEYVWIDAYKSYSNRLSISRVQNVLQSCGFNCLEVRKVVTNKLYNQFESIIIAERNIENG